MGRPVAGQVLLPVTVPAFTGLNANGSAARAEDTGVEVLTRAGDADGLEEGDGTDLLRVITAPHHPHLGGLQPRLAAQAITGAASPGGPVGGRARAGPQLARARHRRPGLARR